MGTHSRTRFAVPAIDQRRLELEAAAQTLEHVVKEPALDANANHSETIDGAQAELDRANTQAVNSVLSDTRAEIDHALDRIATGDYGRCEDCSKRIPAERLRILPEATRCVSCQRVRDSSP